MMKRIFLLARANIRKSKGQMIILVVLFLIAAMLMNVGFALLFNFGNYFEEMAEDLNTSDALVLISKNLWTEETEQLLRESSTEFEKYDVLFMFGEIPMGDNGNMVLSQFIFSDVNEVRNFSQWMLVSDSMPLDEGGAYIPYGLYIHGYGLGDDFVIETSNSTTNLNFTIHGHTESVIMNDGVNIPANIFLPSDRFQQLFDDFPDYRGFLIFANGVDNIRGLLFGLEELSGFPAGLDASEAVGGISFEDIMMFRTMMANMTAMIMVVFTLIISLVSLFVVRFRIQNSLEEDMPKIGSLQAIGYTSKQIKLAIILQYVLVILFASILAIIPTIFLLPMIGEVLATQSGIFWRPGITPEFYALTTVILVFLVWISTTISARGIKKITPVSALRGEVTVRKKAKQNRIPLSQSRLSLIPALAGKSVFQGLRQSLMMFFILLAVSFTAMTSLMIFYNATIDLTAFEVIPGGERANSAIVLRPDEDLYALREEILALPDVHDAQFQDFTQTIISDEFSLVSVMDDFDRRVTRNIHQGAFPRTDNEIALSGLASNRFDVEIGDEVTLGTTESPFVVSGIFSGMGEDAMVTIDGMRRAQPEFTQSFLNIYLYPEVDAAIFTENLGEQYANQSFLVVDVDTQFEEGAGVFASILSLVGIVILGIAVFVILLILYLVIGATIIRKHRELGIQKAIGYTTGNLMFQISLAFSLPIVSGAAIGVLLGIFYASPLFNVALRPMGVLAANLLINNTWFIIAGVIIVALAFGISLLVTWRIRKISAYKLVTE